VADQSPDQAGRTPGADRAGDSFFARRGWMVAVFIGLTAIGTYVAGIVGLLIMAAIGAVFLLVASR